MKPYPSRLPMLTSLRFFAALWVATLHLLEYRGPASAVLATGNLAVDFFFILSGFILCHAHRREIETESLRAYPFLIRRLARIYPLQIATLGFYIVLIAVSDALGHLPDNQARYDPSQLLPNILLVQAWQFSDHGAWNYPSWSVSAEWFAYLLFPPLAYITFQRAAKISPRLMVAAALTLFLLMWRLAIPLLGFDYFSLHTNFGWYRIFPEFLFGMMLYRYGTSNNISILGRRSTLAVVAMALVLLSWRGIWPLVVPVLGILVLSSAEQARSSRTGILSSSPFLYLGEISYALYMVHAPVMTVVYQAYKAVFASMTLAAPFAGLIISIGCAAAANALVERPGRRLILSLLADAATRKRPNEVS